MKCMEYRELRCKSLVLILGFQERLGQVNGFDATNVHVLAFGRSIYSSPKAYSECAYCSRKVKQLHVKVYKYLQVQYETDETSQTSLYQCKKTKQKNTKK